MRAALPPRRRFTEAVAALILGSILVGSCSPATPESRKPATRSSTSTTTTTPPSLSTTTTTTVPIPTDPVLAECQTVVNAATVEWKWDDDLRTPTRCVPAAAIAGNSGRYLAGAVDINAESRYPSEELRARGFRSTAAHELAHAWDRLRLTDAQRTRYMAIRGYTGDWRASRAVEDYAEVFAILMSGLGDATITAYLPTPGFAPSGEQIADRPSPEQLAAICGERLIPC